MGKKLGYAAAIVMAAFVALCLIVGPVGTGDAGRPGTEVPRAVAEDMPAPSPVDGVAQLPRQAFHLVQPGADQRQEIFFVHYTATSLV